MGIKQANHHNVRDPGPLEQDLGREEARCVGCSKCTEVGQALSLHLLQMDQTLLQPGPPRLPCSLLAPSECRETSCCIPSAGCCWPRR